MAAIEAGGWVMIIGATFLGLTQVTSLVLQYMSGRKVEAITQTNQQIHTLVNSNMGVQLKISAVFARRIANMTKGTTEGPDDERAATLAEQYLNEHEAKQRIVDKQ
jgi:hypothetical protein